MYSMDYLHVLIHSVAVHTPNFRDKEKCKYATVNTTICPLGSSKSELFLVYVLITHTHTYT